jgi:hypothetical protein
MSLLAAARCMPMCLLAHTREVARTQDETEASPIHADDPPTGRWTWSNGSDESVVASPLDPCPVTPTSERDAFNEVAESFEATRDGDGARWTVALSNPAAKLRDPSSGLFDGWHIRKLAALVAARLIELQCLNLVRRELA